MSARGRPVNYTAVTLTVCVLAAVSFLSQCGRELIPPPVVNSLEAHRTTEFLYRARFQSIKWHTMDMDPFAIARSESKPLMIFIGAGWSQSARRYDEAVFGSSELALRLNREFVSVRIDLTSEPEWRGALSPISRAEGDTDPGFAIWFLQPNGEIISVIRRTSWRHRQEYSEFIETLSFVSFVNEIQWDRLAIDEQQELLNERTWLWKTKTDQAVRLGLMEDWRRTQLSEVKALMGSSSESEAPNIARFRSAVDPYPYIEESTDYSSSFVSPFQTWNAANYRVLLQAGEPVAASDLMLGHLLASRKYDVILEDSKLVTTEEFAPKVDLVNGGFFWLGSRSGERNLEFGKLATDQAEMAAILAHLWRATGEELFRYYSRRALESLLGREEVIYDEDGSEIGTELVGAQFLLDVGPWPSFIDVSTMPNGQSVRHSFSNARLRTELDLSEYWNYKKLGLDSRNNSQMVPFIKDLDTLSQEKDLLDGFVQKAQALSDERARIQEPDSDERDLKPGGMDLLDSAATTVARALEAVRVLGDDDLKIELHRIALLKRAQRLERYQVGPDEVRHSLDADRLGGTDMWLGDFTAYADAMMEVYLATGDESKLLEGKRVLERALLVFGTRDGAVFVAATGERSDMGVLSLYVPSVVDDGQPPALPALVRLAFRYGAVTDDVGLRETATRVWLRLSKLANENPASFASFIAASQEAMLSGCVVIAGEDRVETARQLSTERPGQFVAPALKGVYSPGQYLVVQSSVTRTGD